MHEDLERAAGFRFSKPEILEAALTHKSYAAEHRGAVCNERLEFLGDSILAAVVAHRLFADFPGEAEGSLSKRKSALVSGPSLARWAGELGLGGHLRLGAGEETSGGRERPSILCNAIEALIGAMYLDGGYEAAAAFIGRWMDGARAQETDFKSRLQELLQKRYKLPPSYEIVETSGPAHDATFTAAVRLGRRRLGTGRGKSKKEAEQAAARDALDRA